MNFIVVSKVRALARLKSKRVSASYLRDLDLRVRAMVERDCATIGAYKTLRAGDVMAAREFNATRGRR